MSHRTCTNSTPIAQAEFTAFVSDKEFPCVGAKSALNRDRIRFGRFGTLGSCSESSRLLQSLKAFSREFAQPGDVPVSFVAMFDPMDVDEVEFENLLWQQLQSAHELDVEQGCAWNESVSSDPARKDFSFSLGGRAYFVVGLHPAASRLARRAPFPCLVFNFHDQFESLKATGKYQSMQTAIRARDIALQGTVNPVLARFGEASEALQYSGRAIDSRWACPFHSRELENA